jgi:hypothetical protein
MQKKKRKNMGASKTLISVVTGFVVFMGILRVPFYRTQTSKPVQAVESVRAFAAKSHDRTKSAPFSEPHWSSLTEDELIFWQVSVPSGLFFILISLVLMQLFLERSWDREDKKTEKMKQVHTLTELCESLSVRPREVEAQDEQYNQLQNEIETLRELTELAGRRLAVFQNAIQLVKTVNDADKRRPQLRNLLDNIANKIKWQNRRRSEISSRIASLRRSSRR